VKIHRLFLIFLIIVLWQPILSQENTHQTLLSSSHFFFSVSRDVYEKNDPKIWSDMSPPLAEVINFLEKKVWPEFPPGISRPMFPVSIILKPDINPQGITWPSGEIWINLQAALRSEGKRLLAHEYFHVVHRDSNPQEESWVREGLAQLFEYLILGSLHSQNVDAALENTWMPFWYQYDGQKKDSSAQYGLHLLYFYYLYEQCGKDILFWRLVQGWDKGTTLTGEANITAQLASMHSRREQCQDFRSSLIHFLVARIHNHIIYVRGTDQRRFYLLPKKKAAVVKSIQNLLKNWEQIPQGVAVEISLDQESIAREKCSTCPIFYSQNEFPFRVDQGRPVTFDNVKILMVKVPKAAD
jgi:hypothetical protein